MNRINIQYYKILNTELILGSYGDALCLADWRYRKNRDAIDKRLQKALGAGYVEETSETIEKTIKQLNEYITGRREVFEMPLLMCGTSFQKSVWKGLMQIPFGETASYLELAKRIGNEKAVRAVASAVGANAVSLLIPCHRIIGSDGSLTGYAGGLEVKKKLLELEQDLFTV